MGISEDLWQDDLSHVNITDPLVVSPDVSLREALAAMKHASEGCILICSDNKLTGVFTERDFVTRVLAKDADLEAPISQYMTEQPVSVKHGAALGEVIQTMYRGGYRHLPVIDDHGAPLGTVSVKRIVQYLVDHIPTTVYNLPPRPRQVQGTREGA